MKTYGFLNTIFLVNGVEIGGYSEGDDVFTVERTVNSASDKVSVDGVMTVSLSSDLSGMFGFKLNQTSPSNSYLGGLVSSRENGVFVPVTAQWQDIITRELIFGTQGYIPGMPKVTRGETSQAQEWSIKMERLDLFFGAS